MASSRKQSSASVTMDRSESDVLQLSETNSTAVGYENAFALATDYVDRHLREFQYGVYGIGAVGLIIVIRSLRVFGRFKTVSKIPKQYFVKNVSLRGIVRDVDSTSGALLVEHLPIIRLFSPSSSNISRYLPVRLSGVSVGPIGSQWLQTTTKNFQVEFVLLSANPNGEAESIVTVSEGFLKKRCLNSEMVLLGMGQVAPRSKVLEKNKIYRKLYVDLLAVENKAVGDRRGLWFSGTTRQSRRSTSMKSVLTRTVAAIWNGIAVTVKYSMSFRGKSMAR